ncbi:MAG: hypothetical protein JWN29_2623 [Acidimicrobiales bacterium]|nr:hypothetical protein [Acidimicrobiales bacterium]
MRGVRLTRPSSVTQRALGTAVVGLLAANGFVAAAFVHDDAGPGRRPATASEAGAAPAVRTVTLITTRDGRRLVADPNTTAGRKAIADARRDGGTVQTVPVPARKAPSGTELTVPGATGTNGPLDLGTLMGDVLGDDATEGSGGSGGVGGGGVVEIGQATFDRILEETKTTVTSLADKVGSTPSTITSIVSSTPSTVTSILQGVPSTITSVLPTLVPPASSIPNQAPITPSTSLLSGLGATVTSLLQPVHQQVTTTVSVPPSPPPPAAVCGLLVHC